MPNYVLECPEGHRDERFVPLANFDDIQICQCGEKMSRVIQAPIFAFATPEIRYQSPRTGEVITSRSARENDLAKHNCIPYDPGMKEDDVRRRRESDDKLEKSIGETAEMLVERMPTSKRAKLNAELEAGTSVETVRSTPVGG